MIVKNGEILAIDHIAHDNTLSGNGTSAKPVGLSQSTKDLIDSKVKKTDFETYKSSAANQISNINTKITTDESNFNSYKSSAHNEIANFKSSAHDEIARVDSDIAAVNAAKVDKTTFTQYQTDVANSFTAVNKRIDDVDAAKVDNTTFDNFKGSANGELTGIKQSITDLDNAKQAKGDYVSASNFNSYKSSAHNEIARVDGRIDATNTNLDNNYYDITETYNKTEVDEKFANFGGFKFRDPDPTKGNEPKLAPEEVIDPKAIYLTQPAGASQYLQWIWNTEVTPNAWKCIGDTTMDLSDYAKTVDVVQSANNNVQTVKDWADDKFETEQDFESVIAGYYTKDEVNTELATKVDNDDFNAYKTEVAGKFTNTSAWANEKFATKQNLTDTKAELEDTIESVSGEIISKVNTDYGTLDGKIDAIATTLSNDYYTSQEIDAILAASGEYYTKTESDTKYAEKEVFNTAINELSSNKLDKSATANWDVTEYTEGENIKIVGHEISGKDWSNEIADAVENKVDESELENYVTKTDFNKLDNEVGAIDDDLDILSGKTVSVIKNSETVKAIRSTEPDGTISYTLSAHDGKQADYLWKPTVNAAGDISWELALTGDTPDPANIKGPQGIQGVSGTPGKNGENGITPKLKIDENDIWNVSYDNEETWTSLGISATGPKGEIGAQGPQGISGTPGKNGENGITPHIGNNNHWFIGDDDTGISATGPQGPAGTNGTNGKDGKDGVSPTVTTATIEGGNRVTFTYGEGSTEYIDVMSGVPGLPGVSPTVTVTNIPADPSDPDHKNGGTEITITDATSTNKFSAWNGNDGTMAGAPDIEGKNGISAVLAGTTYEVGLFSEFYTAITSVSSTYATKDALDAYLTKNDAAESYQPKGDYLSANALNGYATQSWVEGKNYLKADDITGKADKTELETVSGEIVNMIPSLNGYATEQYVQGASAGVTAWVGQQGFLKNTDLTDYATKSYANEASANALSQAESWVETEGYLKSVPDITATNGISADGHNIGLTESVYSAIQEISAANDLVGANGISVVAGANNQVIIAPSGINPSKQYAMTTTGWEEVQAGTSFTGVTTTGSISGGGVNNDTIGLLTSAENALTAVAEKLDITAAEQTYQTIAGMSNYLTTTDAATTYLPLTGGTVSGQVTISGDGFNNNLYLKRDNNDGFIGLAGNGAITLKNNVNGSTSQIEFLTSANKTFDITVKDNNSSPQPVGKLYVMSAHSLADAAATSANWTNDGMLHIILDS